MRLRPATFARIFGITCLLAGALAVSFAPAQQPYSKVTTDVNNRLVKLFGAGGFKGLPAYGTGVVVSAKGHILTVNNHILSGSDLKVHLYDGRQYHARLIAREPELDLAMLKIEDEIDFLPHYDIAKEAARPLAEPGAWVLAFSNQFKIATRDEPMSVMRGVISAYTDLRGRRGVFDASYSGEAYFLDCIANNPGAAGGAVVSRKGELLGIIGRELKNSLSDTWINYAMPVQATVEVVRQEKTSKVSVASFVQEAIAGTYKQSEGSKRKDEKGGFHGIVLVANAVSTTPPYVEEVLPGSPGAAAGLRPDDLIVYIDGELVQSIKTFRDIVRMHGPGEELKLEVQRGNRLQSVKLKLADQPKAKTP